MVSILPFLVTCTGVNLFFSIAFSFFKAALILSASVTFLSLPGLDGFTRTPSMVAVLFAAFAVAATGVAVLRHKADLERPISYAGVEGIVGISVSLSFSSSLLFVLIICNRGEPSRFLFLLSF